MLKYILVFLLSGCTHYVYIPVATCPKPPVIVEKQLMMLGIKDDSPLDDKLKALTSDYAYLYALKNQYKILLEGYSKPVGK
jgi:hypothetical protein